MDNKCSSASPECNLVFQEQSTTTANFISRRSSAATNNSSVGSPVDDSVVQSSSPVVPRVSVQKASNTEEPSIKRTNKERRFHRLFRSVPLEEILLNRFSCAFVSDIGLLIQGHMYVSNGWICFHSNIFGIEKIIEIAVDSILAVNKAKTAKIIPNAVCIRTKNDKEFFFASLISRHTTHNLLSEVLNRCQKLMLKNGRATFSGITAGTPNEAGAASDESLSAGLGDVGGCRSNQPSSLAADSLLADDGDNTSSSSADSSDDSDDDGIVVVKGGERGGNMVSSAVRDAAAGRAKVIYAPGTVPRLSNESRILSIAKRTYELSILPVLSWFSNLPTLLMILIVCVFLLSLLLLFAAALTFRLVYMDEHDESSFSQSVLDGLTSRRFLDSNNLDKINALIESSVKMIEEVKHQLHALQSELNSDFDKYHNFIKMRQPSSVT